MHKFDYIHHLLVRQAIGFSVVFSIFLVTSCATTYTPTYQGQVIQKQAEKQAPHRWVYPSYAALKQVPLQAGLNGVEKPSPLPSYVPDREPAYVVSMNILSDGSFVGISPLEYTYEPKKFTFATYYRERITRVNVVRYDSTNGTEKWSRTIAAEGVYDTTEINNTLLFSANNFDKYGEFLETKVIALDIDSGAILWTRRYARPFRYFSISQELNLMVFSTKSNTEGIADETVEVVDVTTGITRWSAPIPPLNNDTDQKNTWPVIIGRNILLFEAGVSMRRLSDGAVVWSRKDIEIAGFAQPVVFKKTAWFQTNKGMMALDVITGKTKWTSNAIKDKLVKIAFSGKHLYVTLSKTGFFGDTQSLAMIAQSTGVVLWRAEMAPVMGNIVEDQHHAYFTTADHLVTLRLTDGSTVHQSELPWKDEFSSHILTVRGDTVTVKNEWNVAMWKLTDHKTIYHHAFEPLCPIMTTRDRMLEQKKFGAATSPTTVNATTYNNYINTAYFSSQFNQAMSNYSSTGNSAYLSSAQASYGLTQNAMAQNRALAGMQFGLDLSMATMQIGTAILHEKAQVTGYMVYPQIDAVMKKHRIFDNGEYVVRLVGVQDGNQRFSAMQVVHEPTGKSTKTLLSPSQMPSELTTFARSPMTAQELNGYYSAAMYLGHSFSTVVDLKRNRIFHYGPGLAVSDYVTYGNTNFVRGRLWRFDFEPPEKI